MSSKHTPNYSLCQWEAEDQVLRADFNADNAKIDAALKAEADTRTSAVAALSGQVAGKGNCRIWSTTYTGTGSSSKTISFPGVPLLAVFSDLRDGACYTIGYGAMEAHTYCSGSSRYCDVSWNGSSVSLSNAQNSANCMNENGKTYQVVALLSMS